MKLALSLIVKGKVEEAEVLSRCLTVAAPHVDGIFITLTHKPGETVDRIVEETAKLFGANISYFEWKNDFAAARNFNFSQVPKEYDYISWLDADDVPRGWENLKTTVEAHSDIDIFSMFYLYAFDEHKNPVVVHHKTRVIKNDGCVEWAGRLHEDFKENREVIRLHIKDIDVLHLSYDARFEIAKERNYEIALEQLNESPNDPRSYWNAGNSAAGCDKTDEAMGYFDKFLELSKSEDEKYIVRQRRAEVFCAQSKMDKALDEASYAIGMKPEYPDAYHLKGKLLYQMGRYEEAKDMFLNGLVRKAPYYKIVVYNPREYDYVPLMNLARTYYALNFPQLALPAMEAALKIVPADESLKKNIRILKREAKAGDEVLEYVAKMQKVADKGDKEKLQKLLDKVPDKYKYHPKILFIKNTNFPKTESTGKDLVVFCGHTEEQWTPTSVARKGTGGSEEAIITLTEGLKERGWNVTVYNNCGTEESEHNGITYKPYMSWNFRDKQDVTIIWRSPGMCKYKINSSKVFVDMHDVIPSGEFTEDRLQNITKVFFKSQYHRGLFPNVPDDKAIVLANGIHPEAFAEPTERDNNLIINTSSPVRSLTALIDIMKEVRKEVPDAKCLWAYGWVTTDFGLQTDGQYAEWKHKVQEGMKEAGIEDIGRLNFKKVAELYRKANLFVYPTGFPEIDCISLTKAMAGGAFPLTTDFAALAEKQGGEFIHLEKENYPWVDMSVLDTDVKAQFVEKVIHYLKNPLTEEQRATIRKWATDYYAWDKIIDKWHEQLGQ